MPFNHEWQSRIKTVEREYLAMRQAAAHFQRTAHDEPTILQENLSHGDIVAAAKNLEGTYFVRLFAEFEAGVRQYWDAYWATNPRTVDLLDGLAARRRIADPLRLAAHRVRQYRNGLVHEREEQTEVVPIADARHYLCHFFSFLPRQW